MSTLRQLGDTLEELSDLLGESIVLPVRRSPPRGGERTEARGSVAAGGGWEVTDEQVLALLREAGGRQSSVLVLTAGPSPGMGERYVRAFRRFGVLRIEAMPADGAAGADRAGAARAAEALARADLVVLGGPQPDALLGALRRSGVAELLAGFHRRGGVVAAWGRLAALLGEFALLPTGLRTGLALAPGVAVGGGVPPADAESVLTLCASAALEAGREAPLGLVVPRGSLAVVRAGRTIRAAVGSVLVAAPPAAGAATLHVLTGDDVYDLLRAQVAREALTHRLAREVGPA